MQNKYEVYDYGSSKNKKGLTYQKIKSIESKKIDRLTLSWFNYENYGKSFYLYNKTYNRLYVLEYSKYMKRNWVNSKLKADCLFVEKEVRKKVIKHENQTSMF